MARTRRGRWRGWRRSASGCSRSWSGCCWRPTRGRWSTPRWRCRPRPGRPPGPTSRRPVGSDPMALAEAAAREAVRGHGRDPDRMELRAARVGLHPLPGRAVRGQLPGAGGHPAVPRRRRRRVHRRRPPRRGGRPLPGRRPRRPPPGAIVADGVRQRGSVLLLFPAAVLIVLVLSAITVDSSIAFLAQRELANATAAAANDAASRAVDGQAFYRERPDRARPVRGRGGGGGAGAAGDRRSPATGG